MTVFTCSMLTLFAFSSFLSNIDKDSLKNIFSSVNMTQEEEIIKIAETKKILEKISRDYKWRFALIQLLN